MQPTRIYWYRQTHLGRFEVIHWKGWVATLAFFPIALIGMSLETWLKQRGNVALYYLVMLPFGVLVVGAAAALAGKIDRG